MNDGLFFRVNQQDIDRLRDQWLNLLNQFPPDENESRKLFDLIAKHYSEKSRFYHNLSHIKALLESSDGIESIENRAAVHLAIWFHDVIYKTRRSDNEEKSAEMAVTSLGKLFIPTNTINMVRDMILATKTHEADSLTEDAKIFLDLDLAILGTREEIYKAYSAAIRKEYSWVPGFLYKRGRKNILESFLNRESIYYTEEMTAKYTAQARRNIENELRELKA
jgi:predicted metal-dependent HD superfamily phosphohydrolase